MEFTLRPLKLGDASAFFAEYAGDAEAISFLPFDAAKNVEETTEFVRAVVTEIDRGDRIMLSIVDENDRAMGNVDFRFTNNRCEIGFVLGPKHRNQGIVKAAVRGALAFLAPQLPNMLFFAYVDSENIASQRVLAACGFERDAAHDRTETRARLAPQTRTMWYMERPQGKVRTISSPGAKPSDA